MGADRVVNAVEKFVRPVLAEMEMELVEVQFRQEAGWVLRIFIDREGGVNVDHCAAVSRQVGAFLEVEDIVAHAYTLEVSSPGVERPLKRMEDYVRFVGRKAKIKLKEPVGGQHVLLGTLIAADSDEKKITLAGSEISGGQATIDLEAVVRARLSL